MPSGRPLLTIVTDATCVPKTGFAFGTRVNRRQRQGIAFESLRIWRSANAANLTQAAAGESSQIHSKAPRPTTRLILQHHEGVDRDANAIPLFLIESLEVFASFLLWESERSRIGRFYKQTLSFFPIAPAITPAARLLCQHSNWCHPPFQSVPPSVPIGATHRLRASNREAAAKVFRPA